MVYNNNIIVFQCLKVGETNENQLDDGRDAQSGEVVNGEDDNSCTTNLDPQSLRLEGKKLRGCVYLVHSSIILQKQILTRL